MICLNDKVALITGASGSIGGEIARTIHAAGATVVLSGTRREALESLAQDLGADRVHILACNLSDPEDVESLIPAALKITGRLDILINNAGLTRDSLIMRMKDDDWQTVIDVNLTSTFRLCRAAAKVMMKQRFGRIINITSVVGVTGNPGQVNYCASKAGMIGLSKSLAQELATRGVTVNCVAPGFIESPMTDVLPEATKTSILSTIPQNKMGHPRDIAFTVAFLSDEKSGYITGQTIHVNGGMAMI